MLDYKSIYPGTSATDLSNNLRNQLRAVILYTDRGLNVGQEPPLRLPDGTPDYLTRFDEGQMPPVTTNDVTDGGIYPDKYRRINEATYIASIGGFAEDWLSFFGTPAPTVSQFNALTEESRQKTVENFRKLLQFVDYLNAGDEHYAPNNKVLYINNLGNIESGITPSVHVPSPYLPENSGVEQVATYKYPQAFSDEGLYQRITQDFTVPVPRETLTSDYAIKSDPRFLTAGVFDLTKFNDNATQNEKNLFNILSESQKTLPQHQQVRQYGEGFVKTDIRGQQKAVDYGWGSAYAVGKNSGRPN